jgi:hypothetical protein
MTDAELLAATGAIQTRSPMHRRRRGQADVEPKGDLIIDHRRSLRPDGLKPC